MLENVLQNLAITKFISWVIPTAFGGAVIIFVVLGIVLAYHWRNYSYNAAAAFLFQICYWSIGGGLLILMAFHSL